MPKSKRAKLFHLTQVDKKGRERKEKLFENIRECIPQYQHCLVFSVDNMRNNYLKDVRRELSDCRIFFGKTKLMARALGQTAEDEQANGLHRLAAHLAGSVGLVFTDRDPAAVLARLAAFSAVDFARAGAVAPRDFAIPPGVVYSTGGEVPPEDDVVIAHTMEPELRRLGVPTRMVAGKVVLGGGGGQDGAEAAADDAAEGYTVCKEGQVLDSRQTRLLKMFGVCMSEFRVRVLAYWTAASGEVTEVEPNAMDGVEKTSGGDDEDEDED